MPDLKHERACPGPVAGVDEAGRGPLAGPVVAAAVILPQANIPRGLDDSKKLTAAARAMLHGRILHRALVGVGVEVVGQPPGEIKQQQQAQVDDSGRRGARRGVHGGDGFVARLKGSQWIAQAGAAQEPGVAFAVQQVAAKQAFAELHAQRSEVPRHLDHRLCRRERLMREHGERAIEQGVGAG